MGEFDVKATTEYILKTTGADQLAYVGHSQGSTQGLYALSLEPEFYKKSFSIFVALAPPLYFDQIKLNYVEALGPMIPWILEFMKDMNIHKLNEFNVANNWMLKFFCHDMAYMFNLMGMQEPTCNIF